MEHGAPLSSRSLAERVSYAILGVALVVLAFFFLAVALIAGAIVALVVIGRLWWISRKLRQTPGQTEIEGEFTVVERRESVRHIAKTPPESGSP